MFLTQAQGKLDGIKVFGCDGLDGLQTKVSDTDYAGGCYDADPLCRGRSRHQDPDLRGQVHQAPRLRSDQFAADAYDAVYAVKAAMEACGKTPADADFTSAMVDAMYNITVDGLTGTMKWDATREPDKNAKAMVFAADGTTSLLG